jgi:hypothetical protein
MLVLVGGLIVVKNFANVPSSNFSVKSANKVESFETTHV